MKDLLHMPHLSAAEAAADDRLDSLGHAGEDGDHDQRQIRDDSIGRHPHIARQRQENLIKQKHDDPGGNLCNQGGNPQGKDSPGLFAVQRAPDRPEQQADRLARRLLPKPRPQIQSPSPAPGKVKMKMHRPRRHRNPSP